MLRTSAIRNLINSAKYVTLGGNKLIFTSLSALVVHQANIYLYVLHNESIKRQTYDVII